MRERERKREREREKERGKERESSSTRALVKRKTSRCRLPLREIDSIVLAAARACAMRIDPYMFVIDH